MEINKKIVKNIGEFVLLGLVIYFMHDLFNLILFTFLFSYIIYNLQKFIVSKIPIHKNIVTIFLYTIIIGLISFFISKYVPEIIKEVQIIFKEISTITVPDSWAIYVNSLTEQIDIAKSYDKFMNTILSVGKNVVQGSLNVFIALMLSMFFVLEKEKIVKFVRKFKTSKISCVYNHFEYFGTNFLNSFGKVIQAQFLIALANTFLSVLFLWIMNFPQLMGLGFMIFILSFIPVAGTVISLIPLCLIAFNLDGLIKVVSVIIMITLIHCLESYILNPKLMSDKTSLPIFFIFIILIIGKHFMGVWGLLLGIPLFIFILDILDVKISDGSKK
ncbi:AI-2E family transporter [Clostridium thailandense]|uniref:AI-2E family transporter n=1 Tax=Clostridium thailandense TaxID=2794346 RepID=UPI00398A477B